MAGLELPETFERFHAFSALMQAAINHMAINFYVTPAVAKLSVPLIQYWKEMTDPGILPELNTTRPFGTCCGMKLYVDTGLVPGGFILEAREIEVEFVFDQDTKTLGRMRIFTAEASMAPVSKDFVWPEIPGIPRIRR